MVPIIYSLGSIHLISFQEEMYFIFFKNKICHCFRPIKYDPTHVIALLKKLLKANKILFIIQSNALERSSKIPAVNHDLSIHSAICLTKL